MGQTQSLHTKRPLSTEVPGTNAIICRHMSMLTKETTVQVTYIVTWETETSLSAGSFDELRHHERREEQDENECAGEGSLRVAISGALDALGAVGDLLRVADLSPLLVAGDGGVLKRKYSAESTQATP